MTVVIVNDQISQLFSRHTLSPLIPDAPWNAGIQQWLDTASDEEIAPDADPEQGAALRSALYLWNDCLTESHALAQELPTPVGAYLHGIMHRREPDYWNAKYWFRNAGDPGMFDMIFKRIEAIRKTRSSVAPKRLMAMHSWNPELFVDVCERYEIEFATKRYLFLQQVQEIEIQCTVEFILRNAGIAAH